MLALTSASALSSINWLRLLTGCRSFSRYVSHVLDGIYSNLCILLPIDLGAPAPAWDSYFRIIYFEFYWFYYLLNLTLHSTTDKSSRVQSSDLSKILFFILKNVLNLLLYSVTITTIPSWFLLWNIEINGNTYFRLCYVTPLYIYGCNFSFLVSEDFV